MSMSFLSTVECKRPESDLSLCLTTLGSKQGSVTMPKTSSGLHLNEVSSLDLNGPTAGAVLPIPGRGIKQDIDPAVSWVSKASEPSVVKKAF
jgi:hypothetical protein